MTQPQLKLVTERPEQPHATDPCRQVFEHWAYMEGRSLARCKLGPTRSAAIQAALTLYDMPTLMLAIEGMAADPLADVREQRMRDAMREIEWLLAREARIERWAEAGERLHAKLHSDSAKPPPELGPNLTPQQIAEQARLAAEARARCRELAARLRAGGR